jgi:hypothetical protein
LIFFQQENEKKNAEILSLKAEISDLRVTLNRVKDEEQVSKTQSNDLLGQFFLLTFFAF